MVLATKSKNYSSIFKAIIIFLSVFSMLIASFFGMRVVKFIECYGDAGVEAIMQNKDVTFIDSESLQSQTRMTLITACEVLELGFEEINDINDGKIYEALENAEYATNYINCLKSTKALRYYVVNKKTNKVLTNFKSEDNYKTIVSDKQYAYSVVGDRKNVSKGLKDNWDGILITHDYFNENYDLYVYFDVLANGYVQDADEDDAIAQEINNAFDLSSMSVKLNAVLAVVLALASIGLAIFAMVICGKRLHTGKVKPLFIDYVPLDIHLAITGTLVGLLVFAICLMLEDAYFTTYWNYSLEFAYRKWCDLGICGCAGAIQLLLVEFFTSLVRTCKGARKWYKTTLITLIVYAIVKLNKKIFGGIKEVAGYKPQAFKRRLIAFLTGYALINVILMSLCLIFSFDMYYDDLAFFICIMSAILWFVMNIASVVFVTLYVINLDKIIVSARNRTVPNVNYNKLPKSLKMLVDSLQYTNNELNNAVAKAVKDERMRTELITNVSHDLKTPLTSIINYVDLLKGCDITDDNAREYINVLDEKGIKLKRLIEDLIEASKVTSGVITLNPVNLNLSELSTQAVVEHQQEFIENGLELVFKGDKNSVIAFADGNKTFRVIENLLSNARKYSAKGSRVYADVFEENNTAIFEIKNISAEPLDITADELKERFVRGDKARTNEGNGLGLSIADNLCKAMNGRLELIIDGDYFKARVILPRQK